MLIFNPFPPLCQHTIILRLLRGIMCIHIFYVFFKLKLFPVPQWFRSHISLMLAIVRWHVRSHWPIECQSVQNYLLILKETPSTWDQHVVAPSEINILRTKVSGLNCELLPCSQARMACLSTLHFGIWAIISNRKYTIVTHLQIIYKYTPT